MNLINEAYCNDKDKKLWINGEQKQRIGSVEQANEMIPNMYVTRNQSSNEIIGIIVAKISDDNGVVIIGPVAIKPKFQACSSTKAIIGEVLTEIPNLPCSYTSQYKEKWHFRNKTFFESKICKIFRIKHYSLYII